ncbi:Aste57867_16576 [Aphanomyces stellatus]|uniref:histone acetyltransferase n=1 Tax=Aphanomyces stellatus TaxID=120398 RepID=A0A485L5S0_9STRA|nr:hypothetical protein As57867_016519 [Aphanomyces stellatus]VFT93348.1 Aste57867_16576 [Aphanomyces stellatus]
MYGGEFGRRGRRRRRLALRAHHDVRLTRLAFPARRCRRVQVERHDLARSVSRGGGGDARRCPGRTGPGTTTIFLFQKQHGVDVCLFAMYVHEYDDATAPNRRSAYSVRYLEPAVICTALYHSILISYFDYIRR